MRWATKFLYIHRRRDFFVFKERNSGFLERAGIKANPHKAPRFLTYLCGALQAVSRLGDWKHIPWLLSRRVDVESYF